jgi:hypothetical protein
MKKVAMKGSGLPKASILMPPPAKKASVKMAKPGAKKAGKSLMAKRAK